MSHGSNSQESTHTEIIEDDTRSAITIMVTVEMAMVLELPSFTASGASCQLHRVSVVATVTTVDESHEKRNKT